jgi:hypothetical protein
MLKNNQKDRPYRNVIGLAVSSMMGRAEDIHRDIQQTGKQHLDAIEKVG